MTISIRSRKNKGRLLQNWVAERISMLLDIPWGKDKDIQGREMGQSGEDIKLYGKARELFPYSIECKSQETWAIPSWIKQAKENQKEGTDWLLVCKKNRERPVVILYAEVFFEIYGRIKK
jgi:hypothetical protein